MVPRLPEFKSFEEAELPKHSQVKRQSSAPQAAELELPPDVSLAEWRARPTHDILQKLEVRRALPRGPEGGRRSPRGHPVVTPVVTPMVTP